MVTIALLIIEVSTSQAQIMGKVILYQALKNRIIVAFHWWGNTTSTKRPRDRATHETGRPTRPPDLQKYVLSDCLKLFTQIARRAVF